MTDSPREHRWYHYKAFWAAPFLALTLLALALVQRAPDSLAFCELCGAEEVHGSWVVRGTAIPAWHRTRIAATPMNELLTSKGLVGAHQHCWLAPREVPDPLDEFGPPVVESLGFVNAPRVVNFMRNLSEWGDNASITQWRALLLRPEYSYCIDGALRFLQAPVDGFAAQPDFNAWWGRNGYALYNRLREVTEPD